MMGILTSWLSLTSFPNTYGFESLHNFFSGVQQSVNTFISDRIHKGNSDFDLAQWCSHRNVNDVRTVHNNASASASYSSSETDIFTNPTASPFANQASTDTQNLSKGVRSDSFTNVDIVSPNIQWNIIYRG